MSTPWKNLPNKTTPVTAENLLDDIAIIDSGSNENGEYIKFSDGTMICRGIISSSVVGGHQTLENNIYKSAEISITFPVKFVGNSPQLSLNAIRNASDNQSIFMFCRSLNTSGFVAWSGSLHSSSSTGFSRTYIAIGKWK